MRNDSPFHRMTAPRALSRRDFLWHTGGGLGGVALASMLGRDALALADDALAPAMPAIAPKAKRVVQLFMSGAASHLDLFDFKPDLIRYDGKPSDFGEKVETFQDGLGPWLRPVWDFKPYGQCGKMLGETVAELGAHVDDIAFIHNVTSRSGVHSTATMLASTGFQLPGFPGAGCWVSYGLGSMNENLPTFVVLPDHRGMPSNGVKNWDSAFLPNQHSGTVIYPGAGSPMADLHPHAAGRFVHEASERDAQELLAHLNRTHAEARPDDARLDARIKSYELAARMQLSAPEAVDMKAEPEHVLRLYGLDRNPETWDKDINDTEESYVFAQKCLTARRLLERGVRFVQVWSGNDNSFPRRNWDSHEDIRRDHGPLSRGMARGAAALIADLKQRGMLEDTLVIWTTEFGRMPTHQEGTLGRDHNPDAYTVWMLGAGVKPASSWGATDDFGRRVAENPATVYDFWATVLHLLGLNHEKLTWYHNGLNRRLTDVHGHVLHSLLA